MRLPLLPVAIALALTAASPCPSALDADDGWDQVQVVHSPPHLLMQMAGHWSVATDMGPPFDQKNVRTGAYYHGTAEAEARGAQVRASVRHVMEVPDWVPLDADYYFEDAISAVAMSWFRVTVTWHQNAATEEGAPVPVAACAISVHLKPHFSAWIGPGEGSCGANVTGEITLLGWNTGAFATAQRSLWKQHWAVPIGGEIVGSGLYYTHDEDWAAAPISTEEVLGNAYGFVAAGAALRQDLPVYTEQKASLFASKPGMHVHGLAMIDPNIKATVDVYYGWH